MGIKGKQLERICLESFLTFHSFSAQTLRLHLHQQGVAVSLVSVYAVLKELVARDIIIKSKGDYTVSLSWLISTSERLRAVATDMISGPYASSAFELEAVLSSEKVREWSVSSFLEVNDLWVQLLITLLSRSKTRLVHELIPHLWYAYLPSRRDEHFQRAFKDLKADIRIRVQGDFFLDHETGLARKESYKKVFDPKVRIPGNGTQYLSAIDGWYIVVQIPRFLAEKLDALYKKTKRDTLGVRRELLALLVGKASCRIKLSWDPQKADQLRQITEEGTRRRR